MSQGQAVPGYRNKNQDNGSFASFDNDQNNRDYNSYADPRGMNTIVEEVRKYPDLSDVNRKKEAESNRFSVPMNELQESLRASKNHVFLSWHNIEFTVPVKKGSNQNQDGRNTRMLLDIDDPRVSLLTSHNNSLRVTGASVFDNITSPGSRSIDGKFNPVNTSNIVSQSSGSKKPAADDIYSQSVAANKKGQTKKILHGLQGFAKPGQLMAIMGASGSGKTSFLNVLGQRLGLSPGCTFNGEIRVNDKKLHQNDFGKFGAFVQQDDVLLETFTPEESFRFAAKLRTNLSDYEIEDKIEDIIKRLSLQNCRNTRIGGQMVKGISGGERKRTSIGYELITDPNLLLCDEPTSGLDSTTSLKICKMLKNEALTQGTTIICTIHQPSAEIFNTFDRLLLLQDGFEIYQGPINSQLAVYLGKELGCHMGKFTNPADYVIKMAQAPQLCNERLNLAGMVNKYYKVMRPQIEAGMNTRTSRYTGISTNFQDFAESRGSGFFTQFGQVFRRNMLFLVRNRKSMAAVIFNSLVISLLLLSLYWNVGAFPDLNKYNLLDPDQRDQASQDYQSYVKNLSGLAFMISNQLSFSASINVLLQVPLQAPVMKRELANKMYSPTAYFLGRFISNMIIQIFYPMIMILVLFWNIGIDTSTENFLWLCAFGLMGNFIYCGQGYFVGIMVNESSSAKLTNLMIIMVMFCTNGVLCNTGTASPFIKFISTYSPSRYNCEGFFRRMIKQVPDLNQVPNDYFPVPIPISQEDILEQFGYTYGDEKCIYGMLIWFGVWLLGCIIGINLKYRNL